MENTFHTIYLASLGFYFVGIYAPRMHAYRHGSYRERDNHTRPIDAALDFFTFFGWMVLPLVYIFTDWLAFADYTLPTAVGWLGGALLTAALIVMWRAYRDLGENWSPKLDTFPAQKLVTDGLYRRIRHPIYTGMWLWAFAHPFLLWNWVAGFTMLLNFAVLYFVRVPREEKMMRQRFGRAYEKYMKRTGRVLPKLR